MWKLATDFFAYVCGRKQGAASKARR